MGIFGSKLDPVVMEKVKLTVNDLIKSNKVIVFSKSYCPYCTKAKSALSSLISDYMVIELDGHPEGNEIQQILGEITGGTSVPRVFINGQFIGGGDDTVKLLNNGKLKTLLDQ